MLYVILNYIIVTAIRIPAIGVAKTTQLRVSKEEIMMDESQECEGEIKGFSQQIMEGVLKSKPCLPQVEISLPLSTVAAMESLRDVFSRNGKKVHNDCDINSCGHVELFDCMEDDF